MATESRTGVDDASPGRRLRGAAQRTARMDPAGVPTLHVAAPLVVGVTGHRNLVAAEVETLRHRVRELLSSLQRDFPHSPLVILSPLAAGADQLAAEVGLELGARLIAPLPFAWDLYAADFADADARQRLAAFRGRAEWIELPLLPGTTRSEIAVPGAARDRQYAEAGRFVARHCHLLLALWDGKPSPRTGGTAQTVEDYLTGSTATDADRAHRSAPRLYGGGDERLLCQIVCSRDGPEGTPAAPLRPGALLWRGPDAATAPDAPMPAAFRAVLGRADGFNADVAKYARDMEADAGPSGDDGAPAAAPGGASVASPAALFRAADWLALHFQKRVLLAMRVIYVVAFLMAMAFNAYDNLNDADDMIYVFLLLFAIGVAIGILARRRQWHRRYLDYRALAEGLRVQDYWRRAGISLTNDPEFAHDSQLQKQDIELGWVRNVMRGAGLAGHPAPGDAESLRAVIAEWVGDDRSGQLGYYRVRSVQRERAYRLTERIGALCLLVGIGISVFMAVFVRELSFDVKNDLIVVMGAFSIFAAVREAYAFRKADRELVRQYRFMERVFGNARKALDRAQGADEERAILRALGEVALAEHVEWAVMHRQRPLEAGRM